MERRELLKLIATASGTALFAGNVFAYKDIPTVPLSDTLFNEKDVALLNEMAEVIIPQTDTPGAKAANVGATMAVLVTDCYTPLLQRAFLDGIKKISSLSQRRFNKQFIQLTKQERQTLQMMCTKALKQESQVSGSLAPMNLRLTTLRY